MRYSIEGQGWVLAQMCEITQKVINAANEASDSVQVSYHTCNVHVGNESANDLRVRCGVAWRAAVCFLCVPRLCIAFASCD